MARSKPQEKKTVKTYEEQFFEKYEKVFLEGDIDANLTREISRTFGIIETTVNAGNDGGEFFGIFICQGDEKKSIRSGKTENIPPFLDGDL